MSLLPKGFSNNTDSLKVILFVIKLLKKIKSLSYCNLLEMYLTFFYGKEYILAIKMVENSKENKTVFQDILTIMLKFL